MKGNKSLAFMATVAQSSQWMLKILGKTRQPTTTLSMVLLVGESRTSDRPKLLIAKLITGALIIWNKVNGTEYTFFTVPTSTRANVRKQMLNRLLLQPRILLSSMTRMAEHQRLFSCNQDSRQWYVPICAWAQKTLTSFLMRQKTRGPEIKGLA